MINSKDCKEIFEILSYMNKEEVMQIPEEILLYLKFNQDKEYKTKIVKENIFDLKNISDNSLNFLIYLDNEYWKKSDETPVNKKYENMFRNYDNVNNQESTTIIKYEEKTLLKKVANLIKVIFKIKK